MKRFLAALGLSATLILPAAAESPEVYLEFDKSTPPGNLAIGPDGRMFMSVHEFYGPELRVVEVMKDGSTRPYPSESWARAPKEDGNGLNGVLGLRADRDGILWMLDGQGKNQTGRIVGWNTRTEQLHAIHYIGAPVSRPTSFLNDLAVDRDHEAIYISDTGDGANSALIVVDLPPTLPDTARHTARHARPEPKRLWGTSQTIDLPPPRLHT